MQNGGREFGWMTGVDVEETIRFASIHNASAGQIHPIQRTSTMTSNCFVKALNRGMNPAFQAFPRISRHVMRHFTLINGS